MSAQIKYLLKTFASNFCLAFLIYMPVGVKLLNHACWNGHLRTLDILKESTPRSLHRLSSDALHAVTFFWYPAILAHRCLSTVLLPGSYTYSADYDDVAIQIYGRYPFSLNVLDRETRSGTTNVIQICGLDPKVATCYDMDQADTRLTCKICNENGRRKIMTWRTALNHSINGCCRQPLDPEVNNWERVSEEEVSKAKKLESSAARAVAAAHRPADRLWTCDRCDRNSFKNRNHFLLHFRNKHSTKPPVRLDDYYCEPVASCPLVEPVLLLSDTARLRPWERMWLLDGRATLHHYGSA